MSCVVVVASSSYAKDAKPGKGKTVAIGLDDSLGANYVTDQIAIAAFKEMGYDVHTTTLSSSLAMPALAQNDLNVVVEAIFPQSQPSFDKVADKLERGDQGMIIGGGINGYLIDKKTADKYHITSLEQFKDSKIAKLFGSAVDSSRAQLISCDPGWMCGKVVDYQIKKFGLSKTIRIVQGKYEPLIVDAVARVKRGEPAFFYTWSPSWVNNSLVPGKDVVWLPTPEDALPQGMTVKGSALVDNVEGCAGGANPCRMAMPSWNWDPMINKVFASKNPAVWRFLTQMRFPLAKWSYWEAEINKTHGNPDAIKKMADDWISQNKGIFGQWIEASTK